MEWPANELMFYGGMILTACSLLTAFIYFGISHIKWVRLNEQLDMEYGKKIKKHKGNQVLYNGRQICQK